jgi:hypothetical protein
MRHHSTSKSARQCLIRLKARIAKKTEVNIRENIPGKSSLPKFGVLIIDENSVESSTQSCSSREGNTHPSPTQKEQLQGDWWLSVKLEHPHIAIDLIESYKLMTGATLDEITYNLQLL